MSKQHYEVGKGGFLISTNKALLDVRLVHQYLSEVSYWARDIPLATVEKSIKYSLCFGMYENGK